MLTMSFWFDIKNSIKTVRGQLNRAKIKHFSYFIISLDSHGRRRHLRTFKFDSGFESLTKFLFVSRLFRSELF